MHRMRPSKQNYARFKTGIISLYRITHLHTLYNHQAVKNKECSSGPRVVHEYVSSSITHEHK